MLDETVDPRLKRRVRRIQPHAAEPLPVKPALAIARRRVVHWAGARIQVERAKRRHNASRRIPLVAVAVRLPLSLAVESAAFAAGYASAR